MAQVLKLLDRFAEIGAVVRRVDNDHLVVRAGATPVPAALIRQLRKAKAEVFAALAVAGTAPNPPLDDERDAAWWRREFHVRTTHWLVAPRTVDEAQILAWGDLQNRWHDAHGRRVPYWQCAGCEAPIGGLPSLDLGDGNRVHQEPLECLIAFGRRWRGDATRALIALGLKRPDGVVEIDDGATTGADPGGNTASWTGRGGPDDESANPDRCAHQQRERADARLAATPPRRLVLPKRRGSLQ